MEEWYKADSSVKPEKVDTTSSEAYVYIRKNIKEDKAEEKYTYDETKILKDQYWIYEMLMDHEARIKKLEGGK